MSNYIVEDEVRNYRSPAKKKKKKSFITVKPVYILIVLILIIFFVIIFSNSSSSSTYSSIEKEMVKKAKDYISYYKTNNEIYLDSSKLNIDLPSNCNILSGVIYKDDIYTPYLVCNDYRSEIMDNRDITLVGGNVIFLFKGSDYQELGYKSPYSIQVSGKVNTDKEGVYNIYYLSKSINYMAIRKVIVVDNILAKDLFPKINLGTDEVVLELGQIYTDNVTSLDRFDGNLTNKIIKLGKVNESEVGEYYVTYSVTNSLGYTTMKTRKIQISNSVDTSVYKEISTDNMTNENVTITIKVVGDNYAYTILPDNERTTKTEIKYEVEENGKYEFIVVNSDESMIYKTVNINNIDKTIPTGTCLATLYSDKTVYSVTITSLNYVVGYNYLFNNVSSGYISSSNYTSKSVGDKNTKLSVGIKDYIGNESTIQCKVLDKKFKYDPNGYRTIITGKARLHIPISEALAKKGHTVNDLNMCIYNRVKEAGPGTRYGVVAAAYGLIDCTYSMTGYVLAYNHTSGKVENSGSSNYCSYNSDICGKLGINTRWGSFGGQCNPSANGQCWHGLNCATFVRWAMCNGGMDLCTRGSASAFEMASTKYFPDADGVYIKSGKVSYYSGKNLTNYNVNEIVRMIKPGDVMATSSGGDHTFIVVGRDENGIYTAEDGYYMRYLKYNDIASTTTYTRILFLDSYYANAKNRNNLYN